MGYSIPSLVRFEQLLDPMKKTYFQNSSFAKFKKFRHKSNFSSKTLILTKYFADSELVRPLCLRFVPKIEKKQKKNNENTEPLNFSVLCGNLQFQPQI